MCLTELGFDCGCFGCLSFRNTMCLIKMLEKEPNSAQDSSGLAALKVFEEMPGSTVNCESTLLDQIAKSLDDIDWEATPMSSVQILNDVKVIKDGTLRNLVYNGHLNGLLGLQKVVLKVRVLEKDIEYGNVA